MKKYRNFLVGVVLSILFSVFSIYYLNVNELNFNISQYNFLSEVLDDTSTINELAYNIKTDFNYVITDNIIYSPESIPIFAYFSVSLKEDEDTNSSWISLKKFEDQMEYLKNNNYDTLNSRELYHYIKNGVCEIKSPVVITFDIGYKNFYENVFPILKKYKFKAILFLITANVDELSNSLTSNEVKEISDYGIDIGIRGNTNFAMNELTLLDKERVIKSGVFDLEKIVNKKPVGFSFPYGLFDEGSVNLLNKYNIVSSFTLDKEVTKKGQNLYRIPRMLIDDTIDIDSFTSFLRGIY